MEFAAIFARPYLGAQQVQRHAHQAVIQMDEHNVIAPLRRVMIENNGPNLLRVRVRKPFCTT